MRARVVVLAASCCESARLLLNSKSSRFPNGLANSSGVVGKYLTDSTGAQRERVHPGADGHAALQRRRRRRHAPLRAVVGRQQGARISRAATTSSSAAASACPATASCGGIQNYPQSRGGGYGAELKDEYRRYYGAFVELRRPRRAGRRARTATARSIRTSSTSGASRCCASTTRGATTRRLQAQAHAGDLPQHHRRRWAATPTSPMPTQGTGLRPGRRRPDHPRSRRHAHGQRSEDVGAQPQLPGARREEPVRRRRRAVRLAGRQEPDVDDHGARLAHVASTSPTSGGRGTSDGSDARIDDDACSRSLGAAPAAAARRSRGRPRADAAAAQAQRRPRAQAAAAGQRLQAEVLHRARVRDRRRARPT